MHFLHHWRRTCLSLILLIWSITVIDFEMLTNQCFHGINPICSWYITLFICCWIIFLVAVFCREFLCWYSYRILISSFLFLWCLCPVLVKGSTKHIKWVRKCSHLFYFLKEVCEGLVSIILYISVEFTSEAIGAWA